MDTIQYKHKLRILENVLDKVNSHISGEVQNTKWITKLPIAIPLMPSISLSRF
jgi:hypothetical protein